MKQRVFPIPIRGLCVLLAVVIFTAIFTANGKIMALSDDSITAPSAILLEPVSGKILYEKNSDEQRPCASITKVMTLLLVMEALDQGKLSLDETLTASEHAASMGGSDIWLKAGEEMSVDDLIKSTVIMSANDAAVVLAERVAGSEEDFVVQMNRRAKELGMENTTFKNCNGLDEDGHLTTAHDVALMSAELLKHPKIFDYTCTWIDYVRNGDTQLVNTNKLIRSYKGITGLKTGTTSKAGSCISATAERNGLKLVAVVLGCDTTQHRFSDASALLDYGYANWSVLTPELPELSAVPVKNGLAETVSVEAQVPESILIEKGSAAELTPEITMEESVEAPVEQGQKLGSIRFCTPDGTELAAVDIKASDAVGKLDVWACVERLFHALLEL
ncbi:MAG: D-alanyl-D-alanine carboxypeptidase [Oscillospiraceae bacterium]|nr:D-alanyl-D-alanine carboxypeptidase [Oscillospiraceae bacterium]